MLKSVFVALILVFMGYGDLLLSQTKPYRGAELRTRASYKYGRFEVRMKSARGSGMLSSFFTYHDNDPNPIANWNEIDIELMGRYTNEIQFNTITPGQTNHVFRKALPFNPHKAFHVYGFEWTPDYVAWLVNGYEVHRQTESHVQTLELAQKIMMNIWQPVYVDWAGNFNPGSLPLYAYYDWVKYYAYTPGVGDNFSLQWIDTFDEWNQLRWDKASHTWDGNNAQFIPDNSVFQDGYMILCLTMPSATGYGGTAVEDEDADPPYLVRAHAFENEIEVTFSEEVDVASAETVSNYIIPNVNLISAEMSPDPRRVILTAENLDPEISHILFVSGVTDRTVPPQAMTLQNVVIQNGLPFPIEINVGGDAYETFRADVTWDAWQEYGHVGGTRKQVPAGTVSGTQTPEIFETCLDGLSFYNIRLPGGKYRLTLLLAESEAGRSGERVFDLFAESQLLADDVDVYARVGTDTALELSFTDISVTDGQLNLYFKPEVGTAMLSGLRITRDVATGIGSQPALPEQYGLELYPNPFNPTTTVRYTLVKSGQVRLTVFNVHGQLIRTLVDEKVASGEHQFMFDAAGLSTGVYFIALNVDGQLVRTQQALLLK